MTTIATAPQTEQQRPVLRGWVGRLIRPALLAVMLLVTFLIVSGQQLDSIEARSINAPEIGLQLGQHLMLSIVSTVLTIVIAIPLGIALSRSRSRWVKLIGIGLGNLGQAIPSIGLVVLLALWIGVGPPTAIIALVVYAVLPVLRNTIAGLEGVDPALIEAGRGMGMSRLAVLTRVELPLAVPVILAGIRTALVLTVASATLATFIGGGGLGAGLVTGLGLNRPILSITFGIIVAAVALLADWLGGLAEEFLRPGGI